jgi:hypothetical protein
MGPKCLWASSNKMMDWVKGRQPKRRRRRSRQYFCTTCNKDPYLIYLLFNKTTRQLKITKE